MTASNVSEPTGSKSEPHELSDSGELEAAATMYAVFGVSVTPHEAEEKLVCN